MVFKDIPGYEGLYQISDTGVVVSNYGKRKSNNILKPTKAEDGYLKVTLYKDGKRRKHSVHRLVALTFIPNPDNLPEVNHKNENKENNYADNLEWCTKKYNCNYGTRNKRVAESNSKSLLNLKPVVQMDVDNNIKAIWISAKEAEKCGFNRNNISQCCNGKKKSHMGYKWKFLIDFDAEIFKEITGIDINK